MAGKLVQVATNTVSSAVSSVTLTGISDNSVYMVAVNNVVPSGSNSLVGRFTESGTPNTTSNYDKANKGLDSNASFGNNSGTNSDALTTGDSFVSTTTTEGGAQFIMYIYNAFNSSEFTFYTSENTLIDNASFLYGAQGGGIFTVTSEVDGVQFFFAGSNNIASGTFTLFKVV